VWPLLYISSSVGELDLRGEREDLRGEKEPPRGEMELRRKSAGERDRWRGGVATVLLSLLSGGGGGVRLLEALCSCISYNKVLQLNKEIYNKGNTLYVSGLSSRTRESELEHKFSKYGNVVSCRLVYDRRTMESRGYGFISMEAVQQADEVIHYLNNTELNGRIVTVEKALRARPRTPTPGRYLGKDRATRERYYGFSGYSGGGGGGGYGGPRGYPPRGGYYDYGPGPTGPHRNYYDYGHRYSPYYRRGSPHYSRRYSRSPPRARSPHARATRPSPPAAPAAARRSP